MTRVLVTGGAGFIGRHVSEQLRDAGYEVTVMLAPGESSASTDRMDLPSTVADVRDLVALDRAVAGHSIVVHMAAIYSLWMKDWTPLYDVNVQGTANVLRACEDAGVDRVVYTSSIAALGVPAGLAPANEDTEFDQHGRCAHYILSKHYAERRVRAAQRAGAPVVTVYPAMPFGPGDHRPTPTGMLLLRALGGAYFAAGPGSVNAVDVRDVARGHLLALENAPDGGRYLLSGHHLTMKGFLKLAHEVGQVSRPLLSVPGWFMRALGRIGDQVGRFTEPLVDSKAVMYTSQHLTYDCSRAETELGYTRRPIEETLADAIDWFRAHDYPEPGMGLWDLRTRGRIREAARKELAAPPATQGE
ncbi:MAG: NAD-dependent epimerase/dehydratase family protein [Deltaproteobacteria bacterium]|nr:NAD-dependent epimerase/dehydratase family protein [Deltaproteobacteria bacterium]